MIPILANFRHQRRPHSLLNRHQAAATPQNYCLEAD